MLLGVSDSTYVSKHRIMTFRSCLQDAGGPNLDKGSNAFPLTVTFKQRSEEIKSKARERMRLLLTLYCRYLYFNLVVCIQCYSMR